MKLPAAAYSAFVATSATKTGSCGVSGEGESMVPGTFFGLEPFSALSIPTGILPETGLQIPL